MGNPNIANELNALNRLDHQALRRTTKVRRVLMRVPYLRETLAKRFPELDPFDIGGNLTMGRYSYNRPRVRWYTGDHARVRIASFVSIADDVVFTIGGGHPLEWVSTFPLRITFGLPGAYDDGLPQSKGDIVIGNDVWIGRGARILSGVTVGDGAVVAAYSVVAKSVLPYAIVAGNPARVLRYRFTERQIERLLEIAWWNWTDAEILGAVDLLNGSRVDEFIARHGPRSEGIKL